MTFCESAFIIIKLLLFLQRFLMIAKGLNTGVTMGVRDLEKDFIPHLCTIGAPTESIKVY